MLLYRVHPWVDAVDPAAPYGPLFVPPGQGAGRWDNPDLYTMRYFSTTPDGAIAETFGHLSAWSSEMLLVPSNDEAVRALSCYEIPDSARLADLADPETLRALGVRRVTEVIERHKRRTQRLAATIFDEGSFDGISWWSSYHPTITLVATWGSDGITCSRTDPLSIDAPELQGAARLIVREVR
ncbi:RES family NAD+ phosphorylase [Brachybacterium tyrofermentans]|uniref:RES family NAD+ phosphorylase n=1 Tax=Brachybacterium tyrofermentans TaxID=47848 RepID=UPI003FD62F67